LIRGSSIDTIFLAHDACAGWLQTRYEHSNLFSTYTYDNIIHRNACCAFHSYYGDSNKSDPTYAGRHDPSLHR
jgi:hypothetical protein